MCSEYRAKSVASAAGYEEPNEAVIKKAAEEINAKVIFKICDIFDLKAVGATIGEVIKELKSPTISS